MENSTKIKIPKKYHKMIKEIYKDGDGYWLQTEKGYSNIYDNCHIINGEKQKEILKQIKEIIPCDCKNCRE